MSIPKEPRQLMINVMYLVLTALLALNVSAEIFNAFEMVDDSLKTANKALDETNGAKPSAIKDAAKKNSNLQTYADRVDPVRELSANGTKFIENIVTRLIDEGGDMSGSVDDGDYVLDENGNRLELRGKKNYDATTRLMVNGLEDGTPAQGPLLKAKIEELKNQFLQYVDEDQRGTFALPLNIDDEKWKNSVNEKASWSDFTFGHMPIGSTLPIFTKFINDIKASEAAVLNYLASKVGVGGADIELGKYRVVASPKQSYIIKGETYEADVFLSAAADQGSQAGISISVDGKPLRADKDGNAKYKVTPSSTGSKTYTAAITVTNPVTEERETYRETFSYEVGERSIAVSATKMNVFYMGVPNPVEVSAAGVNSNDLKVSMSGAGGGSIKRNSDGTYTVNVTSPTKKGEFAYINVSAPGLTAKKEFRVKRIPNPDPMFSPNQGGGRMGNGTFKAFQGVIPWLDNFDFDAKCTITEYLLVRQAKRQDAEFAPNKGGKYNPQAKALVTKASPGDTYIYNDIKCKCPGDKASRNIGSIVVNIK